LDPLAFNAFIEVVSRAPVTKAEARFLEGCLQWIASIIKENVPSNVIPFRAKEEKEEEVPTENK
jgi:hypothetical protein